MKLFSPKRGFLTFFALLIEWSITVPISLQDQSASLAPRQRSFRRTLKAAQSIRSFVNFDNSLSSEIFGYQISQIRLCRGRNWWRHRGFVGQIRIVVDVDSGQQQPGVEKVKQKEFSCAQVLMIFTGLAMNPQPRRRCSFSPSKLWLACSAAWRHVWRHWSQYHSP